MGRLLISQTPGLFLIRQIRQNYYPILCKSNADQRSNDEILGLQTNFFHWILDFIAFWVFCQIQPGLFDMTNFSAGRRVGLTTG
jgi:hypothetical protein